MVACSTKPPYTIIWGQLIQALIFAPEISPDQGKPVSDLGDKAQAFYL